MALEPFAEALSAPLLQRRGGGAEHDRAWPPVSPRRGAMPFVYSIATFAMLRPYEFIRNGPDPASVPGAHRRRWGRVRIWHCRPFASRARGHRGRCACSPDLTVIAPADHEQMRDGAAAQPGICPGPIYYRLGKDDVTTVPGLNGRFDLGHAQVIRRGGDVVHLDDGQHRGRKRRRPPTLFACARHLRQPCS